MTRILPWRVVHDLSPVRQHGHSLVDCALALTSLSTSRLNFKYTGDAKGHRAIYSSVCPSQALAFDVDHGTPGHVDGLTDSPNTSPAIPYSLSVFYAARNILSPFFILGQIPDFLKLLAAVDTFLRFAALKSDGALKGIMDAESLMVAKRMCGYSPRDNQVMT